MTRFDNRTVNDWLDSMVAPLTILAKNHPDTVIIGIRTGGVDVGRYLLEQINASHTLINEPLGELNIAFYRDDFSSIGLHPVVGPSHIPFSIEDRHVILVDDVLGTGRTVRAAMNEIFDYGRPAKITLSVLVQRSGHELPIRADVLGHSIDAPLDHYINLDADSMTVTVNERNQRQNPA